MALEDHYQFGNAASSHYECLLFDLDDTLYPLSSGLSEACSKNIRDYMVQKLGIEEDKAPQANQFLYKKYGNSMAGLKAMGFDFDNDDYHSFVHGRLPYERLKPDHNLRNLLLSLPMRKIIFSNGDRAHVAKALSKLKLEGCFDGIICFETLNPNNHEANSTCGDNPISNPHEVLDYFVQNCQSKTDSTLPRTRIICKPFEAAFEMAFKLANINPQKTIFFDDSVRNIQTAKQLGLKTVLVGRSDRTSGADHVLDSICNIKEALPQLWETHNFDELPPMACPKLSIETYVTA